MMRNMAYAGVGFCAVNSVLGAFAEITPNPEIWALATALFIVAIRVGDKRT